MATYWVCVQVGRGEQEIGDMSVQSAVQTFSNLFLKALTEGAITTETCSIFQYFTTLTGMAYPLLRRWLAPWSIFL